MGQFVSITDTFYIFDIEFYQKLFADNGFMDSLKYFQDTEVDKNAEESFKHKNDKHPIRKLLLSIDTGKLSIFNQNIFATICVLRRRK